MDRFETLVGSPLSGLPMLRDSTSRRASSWDRTGGNDDRLHIQPGQEAVLADITGAGVVRHIWVTIACEEPDFLRKIVRPGGLIVMDDDWTPSVRTAGRY